MSMQMTEDFKKGLAMGLTLNGIKTVQVAPATSFMNWVPVFNDTYIYYDVPTVYTVPDYQLIEKIQLCQYELDSGDYHRGHEIANMATPITYDITISFEQPTYSIIETIQKIDLVEQ